MDTEETKKCRKCNEVKPLADFSAVGTCKECAAAYSREYYRKRSEDPAFRRRRAARHRRKYQRSASFRNAQKARAKDWFRSRDGRLQALDYRMWASYTEGTIRRRALSLGYEYDLDEDWLFERFSAGRCSVTGIPFCGDPGPYRPSVDRIDSSKGYTKDNCRVVVWVYNIAKRDWEDADVLRMAQALVSQQTTAAV